MRDYLTNWTFVRILRLVIGVVIIIQGVNADQWLIVGLGAAFALMPLLNVGCGSTAGCTVPPSQTRRTHGETTIEEVK